MSSIITKIKATFLLDVEAKPKGRDSGHYAIKIFVENPPEDAYAVTYRLHETYYDPVREVYNREDGFAEVLTSYGDYEIQARIRTKSFPIELNRSLYDALEESHRNDRDASIVKALNDIHDN
jgi:transcription initiation factor IIF auxiliary subunit